MVVNILASVAQCERETIGERTAAALGLKRDRGEFCGGHSPYGWSKEHDTGMLRVHEGEQHALRRARTWRGLGLSLRKVGRALEAEGIFPRCGREWHAKTVQALLRAQVAT